MSRVHRRPPSPKKRSLPVAESGAARREPATRWTPELLQAVAEGERRALSPFLEGGEAGATLAAKMAADRADALVAAALAKEPSDRPIACQKGCSHCCASKITVSAPEVLRLAEWLREHRDEASRAALLDRVRAVDAVAHGKGRAQRALLNLPCPLLEDGACSAYEARPLLCRGWSSLDAEACAAHFRDPGELPVPRPPGSSYELASAVLAGLVSAARDSGRDGALLELVAALRIALERPNAGERWAKGLGVFAPAREGAEG